MDLEGINLYIKCMVGNIFDIIIFNIFDNFFECISKNEN